MSLDSLLQFISAAGTAEQTDVELAFAEVSVDGVITSLNPFGKLAWGWRVGTPIPTDLLFAVSDLKGDEPVDLPLIVGGLHMRGMAKNEGEGWFIIGYEAGAVGMTPDRFTFRALMDKLPQPALCTNTSGLASYVNASAGRELGMRAEDAIGSPALSQLIHPEDRWKLAELIELAAKDGSSHATVRFGQQAEVGVLHMVHSVEDEFQSVILPITPSADMMSVPLVKESFYQSFLEQGPIGVVYLDAAGTVTFENHCFRSLIGAEPASSWLGMNLADINVLPEDTVRVLLEICTFGGSESLTTDIHLENKAAPSRHIQIHGNAIRLPDDGIVGAVLLVEDLTELKANETEIENRTRADRVKHGLRKMATADISPDEFRLSATRFLGESLKVERACIIGLSVGKDRLVEIASWSEGVSEPQIESVLRSDLEDLESESSGMKVFAGQAYSVICSRLEANACWIDPVRDNGQFAGYSILAWDEDEKGRLWASDEQLDAFFRLFETLYSSIQLATRYRTTVASIDDALFGFTFLSEGGRRFHFATDQFEMLTGYSAHQLLSGEEGAIEWISDIVHPEDCSLVRAHNRTLLDGHESRLTYRICHADGTIRWLREHATPRTDATEMTAVNGILSDVSEQKAAEIVLLQAKKEAEEADRSKTAFIATMSHEIRTPLGAVNGFSQLLEKELEEFEEELPYDLPDQVHEFVTAIAERSQELLSLVHDLFDLSAIEMGKASLELRSLDLGRLLQTSVEKVRASAERKDLELTASFHDTAVRVNGDARRLGQVFDNLLSNAVKFTQEGSIQVSLRSTRSEAHIEIVDTGIGISESWQEKIFDSFSQEEDWRNRRYEGTGLGLSLVKRLLEMMDGSVHVESEKGKGSTFHITIPLSPEEQNQNPPAKRWNSGLQS